MAELYEKIPDEKIYLKIKMTFKEYNHHPLKGWILIGQYGKITLLDNEWFREPYDYPRYHYHMVGFQIVEVEIVHSSEGNANEV